MLSCNLAASMMIILVVGPRSQRMNPPGDWENDDNDDEDDVDRVDANMLRWCANLE